MLHEYLEIERLAYSELLRFLYNALILAVVVCSSGTRVEYSFASSLFQDSQSTKIIDIDHLAELSSVYLDDDGGDGGGLRFSEINWSGDESAIIFETVGQDNLNYL